MRRRWADAESAYQKRLLASLPTGNGFTEALDVATRTAVLTGHGASILLALTGRAALPADFSVV